jgi:hypothetical protein
MISPSKGQETAMRVKDFDQGVCEVFAAEGPDPLRRICDRPAVLRYPAMGGGWMRLCAEHGAKHQRYCETWDADEGWQFNEVVESWKLGRR